MKLTASEFMRAAVQKLLDAAGDGYTAGELVIVVGCERMNGEEIEQTCWVWSPPEQADWKTDGLLRAGWELRADADID